MANTEHRLGPEHLPGCLALSRLASWNQNEADWRTMLEIGYGWGISADDGTLVASTLVLPYGGPFAWISMVLVLPEHRRMGYATRLLRVAIAELESRGLTPVLDATPAGREVYRLEGFHDEWGFSRLAATQLSSSFEKPSGVRPLRDADWPWILRLDTPAFGATRERLLRSLAARLPEAAFVAEGKGFILGREGREAKQLGPLVARDVATAQALVARALLAVPAPVYLDVLARVPELREWLEAHDFLFQRPFTRMVRGEGGAPGDEKLVYLVAGPELG